MILSSRNDPASYNQLPAPAEIFQTDRDPLFRIPVTSDSFQFRLQRNPFSHEFIIAEGSDFYGWRVN